MGVYAADVTRLALTQRGDPYVFGAEARTSDPNPDAFDCSELVEWVCHRLGLVMPDGSKNQKAFCAEKRTLVSLAKGISTQGALLFRMTGSPTHVAFSLGNGSTMEAKGSRYGVNVFDARNRNWTHAALIPGVIYAAPPVLKAQRHPAWPGRFLTQPPRMKMTELERAWVKRMQARGWAIKDTGFFDAQAEAILRKFQEEKKLKVDGILGEQSWNAAWTAPVTK